MANNVPTVFVSSTCYDLAQIRQDLSSFIEEQLGYKAMLSEKNSFPVDTDLDTIENCRRRVEQDADILVLVIGGRYGYVDQRTSKSITNLEYLTARSHGIPVYAFVEKSVLSILPVWEKNKESDFTSVVDNTRLFEFIKNVRDEDKVWTWNFSTAQDITSILKVQFAHLMKSGLDWRRKALGMKPKELDGLSGQAFRTAIEKPPHWEYRLFGHVLIDAMAASERLQREYDLGVSFGRGEQVSDGTAHIWVQHRCRDLGKISDNLKPLADRAFFQAMGEPGVAGDVSSIVFVAQGLASLYREALEWALTVRRAYVEGEWVSIAKPLEHLCECITKPMLVFAAEFPKNLEGKIAEPGTEKKLTMTITLDGAPFIPFNEEMDRLMGKTN